MLDDVLQELGSEAEKTVAELTAMERDVDHLQDTNDDLLPRHRDAEGVAIAVSMAAVRLDQAVSAARQLRAMSRELAAWWADMAILAVGAAARGNQVERPRLLAAAPGYYLDDKDLAGLPVPDDGHTRSLISLALHLGRPLHAGEPDLTEAAFDLAARSGLRITDRPSPGSVEVDFTVEGRRRRMWGPLWCDQQLPNLPTSGAILELLYGCGLPESALVEVRLAGAAIDDVLKAGRELASLDELHEEHEVLLDRIEPATQVLLTYARALTTLLPIVRSYSAG